MSPAAAKELLARGLKELDIEISESQLRSFIDYLNELKRWNKAYNLTSITKDKDIIIKHFLDSLLYLKGIPDGKLKLADAGSGAGFPGIPIKIIRPEINVTLIESSRKKASFIRNIIRKLDLSEIMVIQDRIEQIGRDYEKAFDVIVSRATFSIGEFLRMSCPFLKKNGTLILNKGPKIDEELKEFNRHVQDDRFIINVMPERIPLAEVQRNIIILKC